MREEARGWLGLIYDWRRRFTSHCEAGNLLAAWLWRTEPAEERKLRKEGIIVSYSDYKDGGLELDS